METQNQYWSERHVAVIIGSVRPGNFTTKAARIVADELKRQKIVVDLIDPATMSLPLPGVAAASDDTEHLRTIIRQATGVVIATPEYHGSFSSVTKLVIENLGFPSVLAGKPVALVGVAAGAIGAVKSLESLRGVCSHVGSIVLPGPVSVARVREVFGENGEITDDRVEKQLRGVATGLIHYIDQNICPRFTLEAMVREKVA